MDLDDCMVCRQQISGDAPAVGLLTRQETWDLIRQIERLRHRLREARRPTAE
jgi:hypothetical protein